MSPEERDDLLLAWLDGHLPEDRQAELESLLVRDEESGRRLAELSLQESLLGALAPGERQAAPNSSPRGTYRVWWIGAAAALFATLLYFAFLSGNRDPGPLAGPPPPRESSPRRIVPEGAPPREAPPQERPELPNAPPSLVRPGEAAPGAPAAAPSPSTPILQPKPPSPEPSPPPPATPSPAPSPATLPEPVRPTPNLVATLPVTLTRATGAAWRQREGRLEPVQAGIEIQSGDELLTTSRRAVYLETNLGSTLWAERGTTLGLELRSDGSARIRLQSGVAFFTVAPRTAPFVVATPEGEAIVTGTSFMVEREEKHSSLSVLEGSVRFKTEKGEVLVKASQKSTARPGEKPSAPAKADVQGASAWRLRPELGNSPAPYSDHEPGGNRKYAGLVIAAPFFEGEADSGRMARAVAERMDAGLALGHRYRDLPSQVWINVDRGMEAEVRPDGTLGPEGFTDRARKATADYLDQARLAAGSPPRAPIPLLVQFRTHYLSQAGAELEVIEAAFAGWDRRTIAGLKGLYGSLLEKYHPAPRPELRLQGVDDTYDYKGARRTFGFPEADARPEGYMAPRNARNAAVFFLNPSAMKRAEDAEIYSKILSELVDYLYQRRR